MQLVINFPQYYPPALIYLPCRCFTVVLSINYLLPQCASHPVVGQTPYPPSWSAAGNDKLTDGSFHRLQFTTVKLGVHLQYERLAEEAANYIYYLFIDTKYWANKIFVEEKLYYLLSHLRKLMCRERSHMHTHAC